MLLSRFCNAPIFDLDADIIVKAPSRTAIALVAPLTVLILTLPTVLRLDERLAVAAVSYTHLRAHETR